MSFNDLALIEPLQRAITFEGYTQPTPIQEQAIPEVLQGRDLLACAQTGTGKTAAFALPILQGLHNHSSANAGSDRNGSRPIRALILTPTRELAIQIEESFTAYGRYLQLRHTVVFGGVSAHAQIQALRRGVDVLVATPGRLLDLIGQGYVNLRQLEFFVLDEADRMLDMGFVHDVRKVIKLLPAQRQSLFFSATMPTEIVKLADAILTNPCKVEVTPVSSTAETIQQAIYFVDKADKPALLVHVLEDPEIAMALVFTRTKYGADKLVKVLLRAGIKAEAIHGNKSQNARQNALNNFKTRKTRVLVATDIAARGIDVDDLSHVINYEVPNVAETYVHRIGRTGRAGADGKALSFCDAEEKAYLRDIQRLINQVVPVEHNHPYPLHDNTPVPGPTPARAPKQQQQPQGAAASSAGGNAGARSNRNRRWSGRNSSQRANKG